MKHGLLTLLTAAALAASSCSQKQDYEYPFQNPRLPRQERIENLISLLSPEEKVGMMMNKTISVDRLGIPTYNWWSEACHGIRETGYTVYPQPVGLGASFDEQLVYDIFSTVSDEARANWNVHEREFNVGTDARYFPEHSPGLTFWCPNVNIFRDPRWGRGQETPGEDPYLSSVIGVATVKGMQGDNDKYYKTHACAKHYAVHSGPEPLRHSFDARVSMRDLWETYLPAFEALVKDADVREVMCAYQRYEGTPCCTNSRLLVDILRDKWGYDGITLTDCDAINNFYNKGQHETHPDAMHASSDAILNGTDLECGRAFRSLVDGLEQGLIKESDLDVHLRYIFNGMMELGLFDPAEMSPWAGYTTDMISSEANDALARKAAQESIVLLKNAGAVLPLSKNLKKIAVVGPNAANIEMLNGNYGGTPTDEHKRSIVDGIKAAVPGTEIVYSEACSLLDDYRTVNHMPDFNAGQGMKVEFFTGRSLAGAPVKTDYYKDNINFSTFGAWGFAEGVDAEEVAVKMTGELKPDFTGPLKYFISSDNGYKLLVNGKLVENCREAGSRYGRRNSTPDYKEFEVEAGKTYKVEVQYVRGNGPFAMLNAQFCERLLVDFEPLAAQVADCDAIIIVGGITAQQEGEGGDRPDIELPVVQQRLIRAMHATGKPVVLVNCSGSAMAFGSVEDQYDALLQAWYAGQGGAQGLADIIFGDVNPSAKLPVTFYTSTDQLPDFLDYNMEGRTYRYFRDKPLYQFGFGLSYTSFGFGDAKLSKKVIAAGKSVDITVPVTNTGDKAGTEVLQIYVKSLDNPDAPIKSLKGFQRVSLNPGQTKKAKVTLAADAFAYYSEAVDGLAVRPGRYQILYGNSSDDSDLKSIDLEVRP